MNNSKVILLMLSSLILVACGGGGGDSTPKAKQVVLTAMPDFLSNRPSECTVFIVDDQINLSEFSLGLDQVDTLSCKNIHFDTLEGVEKFTGLETLSFDNVSVNDDDYSPIKALTWLKKVSINNNKNRVINMDLFEGMSDLESLELIGAIDHDAIEQYNSISSFSQLKSLTIKYSVIDNLDFLNGASQIKNLNLDNNIISNIDILLNLHQLETLSLEYNSLGFGVEFLNSLAQLDQLALNGNANLPCHEIEQLKVDLGAEVVEGGDSCKQYLTWKLGDGELSIDNSLDENRFDRVLFLDDYNPEILSIEIVDNDLALRFGESDSVTLKNYFLNDQAKVNLFEWNDVVKDLATLKKELTVVYKAGDEGGELLGGAGDDVLIGGLGDDILYGLDGDDILEGGDGNDFLIGGEGDDTILGGTGDDQIALDMAQYSPSQKNIFKIESDHTPEIFEVGADNGNDRLYLTGTLVDIAGEVVPESDWDTVRFSSEINPDLVKWSRNDSDLVMTINENNSVTFVKYYFVDFAGRSIDNYKYFFIEFSGQERIKAQDYISKITVEN